MHFISEFIGGAKELGNLSVASVWAFFTLVLIFYIVWTQRIQKQASESAWEARIEESKADGLIAAAIQKLANEIQELRHNFNRRREDD